VKQYTEIILVEFQNAQVIATLTLENWQAWWSADSIGGLIVRYPKESDFTVTREDTSVEITFNPTKSHYSFLMAHSTLSDPWIRHAGPTGDTGEYWSHEVLNTARRLAEEAERRPAA
jgi:hypothetical protein